MPKTEGGGCGSVTKIADKVVTVTDIFKINNNTSKARNSLPDLLKKIYYITRMYLPYLSSFLGTVGYLRVYVDLPSKVTL